MDEESEILFYFTEFLSIQKSKVLDIGEYPFWRHYGRTDTHPESCSARSKNVVI